MKKTIKLFSQIQTLRERYYRAAVDKEALLKLIYETEVAEQVYNSNAIENSTLTLEETEKILQQIDLDRFINEREMFEAKNLARIVEYIHQKATQKELTLEVILWLHKILISNIMDDVAGRFRSQNEWVRVGNHIASNPNEITAKLKEMLATYQGSNQEHIIKRIAKLHLTFEHIHPFVDGNGRIGRVINNFLLLRDGYVPINIKFIDRALYYQAFHEFDTNGNTKTMEQIVGKALSNSYHKRLAYLEGKKIILLSDYAKKQNISHSNLLNKANRQTIEAFRERGIWKIGV